MLGGGPNESEFGRYEPAPHPKHSVQTHQHSDWTFSVSSPPSIMLYPIFRERTTPQHPVRRVWGASPASVSGASRLMRLPNELLVQIWTYMSPKDIENMSLVNRHFHNLGHHHIQEHRRLKQRYLRVETALPYAHKPPMAERRSSLYLSLSTGLFWSVYLPQRGLFLLIARSH